MIFYLKKKHISSMHTLMKRPLNAVAMISVLPGIGDELWACLMLSDRRLIIHWPSATRVSSALLKSGIDILEKQYMWFWFVNLVMLPSKALEGIKLV